MLSVEMTLTRTAALPEWTVAAGSVVGADHRRVGRPNQDSWAVHRSASCLTGVVADGCGSGGHSEVGAWIGARAWVRAVAGEVDGGLAPTDARLWRGACRRSLQTLGALLEQVAEPSDRGASLSDALLFTLVGFVLTPEVLVTYALGDGLVWIDGRLRQLGPFPGNCPPYLAALGAQAEVEILDVLDPVAVEHVIVGTDGALELVDRQASLGSLAQFTAARYLSSGSPDALRRRLSVINREQLTVDWEREVVERGYGPLSDDTTLLVLGRRSAGGA